MLLMRVKKYRGSWEAAIHIQLVAQAKNVCALLFSIADKLRERVNITFVPLRVFGLNRSPNLLKINSK
jgi:hypothetical protein